MARQAVVDVQPGELPVRERMRRWNKVVGAVEGPSEYADLAAPAYFSGGLIMRPKGLPAKRWRWKWGTSWSASGPLLARMR